MAEPWADPQVLTWSGRILASYAARTGTDLLPGITMAAAGSPHGPARALFEAEAVVLCHDGATDPVFVYANAAACRLWRMPWEQLIGMPSRLSAGPEERAGRAAMLDAARRDGVLRGYEGVRRAADGTLFRIRDAVIWTVDDGSGHTMGQAATFSSWDPLPTTAPPPGPPGPPAG